jgi:F0F1-type ATP synthase alpha subunit
MPVGSRGRGGEEVPSRPALPPQAADAKRFAADASQDASATQRTLQRAAVVAAALAQAPGTSVPLSEQVVQLFALQKGYLDDVAPGGVAARLEALTQQLREAAPEVFAEIEVTKRLTAAAAAAMERGLGQKGGEVKVG